MDIASVIINICKYKGEILILRDVLGLSYDLLQLFILIYNALFIGICRAFGFFGRGELYTLL